MAAPSHISAEPVPAAAPPPSQIDGAPDKLHGPKLFVLLASITLATFLALLDTSIVGTVCNFPYIGTQSLTTPRLYRQ
jgi:hypothetical protein